MPPNTSSSSNNNLYDTIARILKWYSSIINNVLRSLFGPSKSVHSRFAMIIDESSRFLWFSILVLSILLFYSIGTTLCEKWFPKLNINSASVREPAIMDVVTLLAVYFNILLALITLIIQATSRIIDLDYVISAPNIYWMIFRYESALKALKDTKTPLPKHRVALYYTINARKYTTVSRFIVYSSIAIFLYVLFTISTPETKLIPDETLLVLGGAAVSLPLTLNTITLFSAPARTIYNIVYQRMASGTRNRTPLPFIIFIYLLFSLIILILITLYANIFEPIKPFTYHIGLDDFKMFLTSASQSPMLSVILLTSMAALYTWTVRLLLEKSSINYLKNLINNKTNKLLIFNSYVASLIIIFLPTIASIMLLGLDSYNIKILSIFILNLIIFLMIKATGWMTILEEGLQLLPPSGSPTSNPLGGSLSSSINTFFNLYTGHIIRSLSLAQQAHISEHKKIYLEELVILSVLQIYSEPAVGLLLGERDVDIFFTNIHIYNIVEYARRQNIRDVPILLITLLMNLSIIMKLRCILIGPPLYLYGRGEGAQRIVLKSRVNQNLKELAESVIHVYILLAIIYRVFQIVGIRELDKPLFEIMSGLFVHLINATLHSGLKPVLVYQQEPGAMIEALRACEIMRSQEEEAICKEAVPLNVPKETVNEVCYIIRLLSSVLLQQSQICEIYWKIGEKPLTRCPITTIRRYPLELFHPSRRYIIRE